MIHKYRENGGDIFYLRSLNDKLGEDFIQNGVCKYNVICSNVIKNKIIHK